MIRVQEFERSLGALLPATYALLTAANFTVHEKVSRVTLHGSRGLAGGYRPDSDVDLSLLVDMGPWSAPSDLQPLLEEVLETTLSQWQSEVKADVAVVFDVRDCGLRCFEWSGWRQRLCIQGGADCFGLFKRQRGQYEFLRDAGVEVQRMYPCLLIFRR
ncbi:MAG TPA: hypothetical protein VK879_12550 [Candidatus Sulfomarinibacteraceae bacterium]|nr:hypothetical protein [Candidatus Sulfomarinibacteraceae bacterium]